MRLSFSFVVLLLVPAILSLENRRPAPEYQRLPTLREQADIEDAWTDERLSKVPQLLRKYGVDAWLISQREHAEDTVFFSMKRATQFAARRRTIQLFVAPNSTQLWDHTSKDSSTKAYAYTWVDNTPEVWTELNRTLHMHDPSTIALNLDPDIVFGGGLHAGEAIELRQMLGRKWMKRVVSVPMLGVAFVANRVEGQLEWYRKLQETAWAMVTEAFSEKVIDPGRTTSQDLSWWFRDKMQSLNYSTWNMPRVSVVQPTSFPGNDLPPDEIINYGDMLHVDFGVAALGMNTDTQHLGYVLHPGKTEKDIPDGFQAGLKKANRLQEIVRHTMRPGVSGNTVLSEALAKAQKEGIEGRIYCHPIGDWGHSAGSLIGMTNLQDRVPVLGDLPLLPNTYYSLELYAEHFVEEKNATYKFMQEEDLYWDQSTQMWEYVWARQERFHFATFAASPQTAFVDQSSPQQL